MERYLVELGQKLQMMAEVEAVKARIEAMKADNAQYPDQRRWQAYDFFKCEDEILSIINGYR